MTRIDRIKEKLSALKPHFCEIIDESHKHAGHKYGGIESHFKVQISTNLFVGKSLIAKHRIINNLLADELANGLHALSIETL
ncbi:MULTISPECIES: BolA family protein [unclassified Rickettsia]|jgi:BolA protein|uniref:BolA family protein n=1 Tax=unclassified Rickettsia TaxID=114295 RepID=UPI0020A10205|nr:BolA family protein [Rickettsia endosymbiont of Ceutorhynchus assimilis]